MISALCLQVMGSSTIFAVSTCQPYLRNGGFPLAHEPLGISDRMDDQSMSMETTLTEAHRIPSQVVRATGTVSRL